MLLYAASVVPNPGPGLREHGLRSGQQYSEDVLLPALHRLRSEGCQEVLVVDLDGTGPIASCWLFELVRPLSQAGFVYGSDYTIHSAYRPWLLAEAQEYSDEHTARSSAESARQLAPPPADVEREFCRLLDLAGVLVESDFRSTAAREQLRSQLLYYSQHNFPPTR